MKKRMKVIRPQKPAQIEHEDTAHKIVRVIIKSSIFVLMLFGVILYSRHTKPELTTEQKSDRIGYPTNASIWMKERHVFITEHTRTTPLDTDITPVHIMTRTSETDQWLLTGTGGLLHKFPGYLTTAYHVMETKKPLQFGYRVIGPREIEGTEPVVPIVSALHNTTGDDSLLCQYDTNTTIFPALTVPGSPVMFKDFDPNKKYDVEYYPGHLRLTTCPEQDISCVFRVNVAPPNVWHIFCLSDAAPGESGTIGRIQEETNVLARTILVRRMPIPESLYEKLPDLWRKKLDWSPTRHYAVIEMIQIK